MDNKENQDLLITEQIDEEQASENSDASYSNAEIKIVSEYQKPKAIKNNSHFFREQKPENMLNKRNQNAISRIQNRKSNTLNKKSSLNDPTNIKQQQNMDQSDRLEEKPSSLDNAKDKVKQVGQVAKDKVKNATKQGVKQTGKAAGGAAKKAGSAAAKGIAAIATNPVTAPYFWGAVLTISLILFVPIFISTIFGGTGDDSSSSGISLNCEYNVGGKEYSDIKIRLMKCDKNSLIPIEGEELVDFEKYVLGVAYAENSSNENAFKAQVIAARSYTLNRRKIKTENGQNIIEMRNCTNDQVYCNPDKGCWSNSRSASDTVYSGVDHSKAWSKDAIAEDSDFRKWASEVNGIVLQDSNENVIYTPYCADYDVCSFCEPGICMSQNEATQLGKDGKDYNQILMKEYASRNPGASTGKSCQSVGSTTPGDFIWPTDSGYITSPFGPRSCTNCTAIHDAIDVRARQGEAIYSIADGEVVNASGTYHTLTIYHGIYNGKKLFSRYQHGDMLVHVGDTVKKGQKIAASNGWGPSGSGSYAAHLDFTILLGDEEVDNKQWNKNYRYNPLINLYNLSYNETGNSNAMDVSIKKADDSILNKIEYGTNISGLFSTKYCKTWNGPCG